MRILSMALFLAAVFAGGCNPAQPPLPLCDGRYTLEIEGPSNFGAGESAGTDSKGRFECEATVDMSRGRRLEIKNDDLKFNGRPLGKLAPGDVIRIDSRDRVLVNGVERK